MIEKEIKELLNQGEDWKAREDLCIRLGNLIDKSRKGEIAIAEYIVGLEKILDIAKEYKNEFVDNPF